MERTILEQLVEKKFTLREMAKSLDLSVTTICYWMKKYGLRQVDRGLRASIIDKLRDLSTEELAKLVEKSQSVSEVLRRLGLDNIGTNYDAIKARMSKDGMADAYNKLVYSGRRTGRERAVITRRMPLSKLLVKDSDASRSHLKGRLLREGALQNACAVCRMGPEWQGREIKFVLDHVNGDRSDNRLSNLRLLCPNCHSQTSTFAGKNIKIKHKASARKEYVGVIHNGNELGDTKKVKASTLVPEGQVLVKVCKICDKKFIPVYLSQTTCSNKCSGLASRRAKRPEAAELEILVWSMPTSKVAKKFGVSGKAIETWCKNAGIAKPPRGYWIKHTPKSECPDTDELRQLINKLPQRAVCQHYHIGDCTFKRWCKQAGIVRRPYAHRDWNKDE